MNMAMAESKYANPGASEYARIRDPWEKGLAVLQPTDAQLEHGLELHRQSIVMDTFSFLPMAVNERLKQEWNDLVEAGVGGNDFHFRNGIYRRVAPTYDESSGREFLEAITCSGLTGMVHTSAEGKTLEEDITRIAASIHTCGHFDPKGQAIAVTGRRGRGA